jgi:hypothetical protein
MSYLCYINVLNYIKYKIIDQVQAKSERSSVNFCQYTFGFRLHLTNNHSLLYIEFYIISELLQIS